jgi:hypothetical protein
VYIFWPLERGGRQLLPVVGSFFVVVVYFRAKVVNDWRKQRRYHINLDGQKSNNTKRDSCVRVALFFFLNFVCLSVCGIDDLRGKILKTLRRIRRGKPKLSKTGLLFILSLNFCVM